jgi:hypothetical protein
MAVFCGVCATQLYDATENYGSFSGTTELAGVTPGKINETCEQCHRVLAVAVTEAANAISAEHQPAIDSLRARILAEYDRRKAAKVEEAEFRRAWVEKRIREKKTDD